MKNPNVNDFLLNTGATDFVYPFDFGGKDAKPSRKSMQFVRFSRLPALATGLILIAGASLSSVPAQARTSSKTYKAGAIALGALGAYYISKGKTVQGAAAVGGGYLAYKKGQKVANQERYGRTGYPRYGSNGNYGGNYNSNGNYNYGGSNSNVYPDASGYDNSGPNYNTGGQNQGYDWRDNASLRPQRGNNGHHYGQYKHGRGRDKRDRENDDD